MSNEIKQNKMFCFQCEETLHGAGCMVGGVCGKRPDASNEQDRLTTEMIALATAMQNAGVSCTPAVDLLVDGLFTTVTNVSFDAETVAALKRVVPSYRTQ